MYRALFENYIYKVYKIFKSRNKVLKRRYYTELTKERLRIYGEDIRINGRLDIIYPKGLLLGNNVHIGDGGHFDARGGIIIGDHTHISRNLTIYSTNHNHEGDFIPYDSSLRPGNVKIGRGVWIGMNVSILPGVTIGDGAIIGMGSVIHKNVLEGEICVNNSQNVISQREVKTFRTKLDKFEVSAKSGRKYSNKNVENSLTLTEKSKRQGKEIVFILSTGRTGSKSIAYFANKHSKINAFHEPFYNQFKVLSTNYLKGFLSREKLKEELEGIYSCAGLAKNDKIYIESDQKLVPFLDILNEIFPEAKYIWLIRNPKSFLKSARARDWFNGDDAIYFKKGVLLQQQFSSTGCRILPEDENEKCIESEEKILQYWEQWNKHIEKFLYDLPSDRKFLMKLEEFKLEYNNFFEFLNLEQEGIKPVQANSVKDKHKKKYSEIEEDRSYTNYLKKLLDYYWNIEI